MGPNAFVIFERKPSKKNSKKLESALKDKGYNIDFGFLYPGDKYWEYDGEELDSIKKKTSMTVCGAFQISCPFNSDEDHQALGEAALMASEYLSGMVDFNGAILPNLPKKMYEGMWLWEEANWSDIEPFFLEMVADMSGNIYTIEYETASDRVWAHHVCDVKFMASWLKNPMFRMIK